VIFCAALRGLHWFPVVQRLPGAGVHGRHGQPTLGGLIAVLALTVRKELMLPLLCGIFLVELLSVIIQVYYFKYTKKKYGEGRDSSKCRRCTTTTRSRTTTRPRS
jgi:phospho-N-acetylmuramoyl-pentapeptide-transferase